VPDGSATFADVPRGAYESTAGYLRDAGAIFSRLLLKVCDREGLVDGRWRRPWSAEHGNPSLCGYLRAW
jgi:hypothetical protein